MVEGTGMGSQAFDNLHLQNKGDKVVAIPDRNAQLTGRKCQY